MSRLARRVTPVKVSPTNQVNKLYQLAIDKGASDIHVKDGKPPMARVSGKLKPITGLKAITHDDIERCFEEVLGEYHIQLLCDEGGVDFSYIIGDVRFRTSLFFQKGKLSFVARKVNPFVADFKTLFLPPVVEEICIGSQQGLVLLAGATGSGKSTTIASMLKHLAHLREGGHILTLEDPIEYIFVDDQMYFNQREVGIDCKDWRAGLRQAMRQDPEIILIGEMRDVDTFEAAINASQTGHLVFSTIHADDTESVFPRILDLFPAEKHRGVRRALAGNLRAIIAQDLVVGLNAPRVPVNEVLQVNPTIRDMILKGQEEGIGEQLPKFKAEGMFSFNMRLEEMVDTGMIDKKVAIDASPNPEKLRMMLRGIKVSV